MNISKFMQRQSPLSILGSQKIYCAFAVELVDYNCKMNSGEYCLIEGGDAVAETRY
jgi:hypothetical protein